MLREWGMEDMGYGWTGYNAAFAISRRAEIEL